MSENRMDLDTYLHFTRTTAIYPDAGTGSVPELMYLGLGLAGESGEVANDIKKAYRDGPYISRERIMAELGDVLYYWTRLCDAMDMLPAEVIAANVAKLASRKARGTLGGSGSER